MGKRQTKSTAQTKGKTAAATKSKKPMAAKKSVAEKTKARANAKSAAVAKSKPVKTAKPKSPVATKSKTTAAAKTKPVAAPKSAPPVTNKKPAPKRETVTSLRAHVDSIVTRFKTADTNNRKSVKSLEAAFAALESQVKSHHKVDHAKLSGRVDELAAHLTSSFDVTKRDIASDLRTALENPTVSGLEAAIERSEQRLADTELAQARALSKVNKHLAELARIIDARFRNQEGETKENKAKITELEQQVSQSYERIALIENLAADAIRKVGDEVVGTTETFQNRLETQSVSLRERIEAIAAKTKEDFDLQKTELSRRLEGLEDSQKNQSNYVDRSISKLAARIDSLEFGLSQPAQAASTPSVIPPAMPETPYATTPQMESAPETAAAPMAVDAFQPIAEVDTTPDEFLIQSPAQAVEPTGNVFDQMAAGQVPAQTPPPATFTDSGQDLLAPQEYQPQPPTAQMAPQHQYVDPANVYAQAAAQATTAQASITQPVVQAKTAQNAYEYDPYQAQAESFTPPAQAMPQSYDYSEAVAPVPGQPVEFTPHIADAELPYDNPGYSENAKVDGMSRPGHVTGIREKRKKKASGKSLFDSSALSNLPLTPRNLRVAGLALTLAVVGYIGLRGFMNRSNPEQPPIPPVATSVPATTTMNAAATGPVSEITTTDPIGSYQDNASPAPAAVTFQSNQSLQEAADSGNAIAQFQLGISYLDSGQTKQGIAYVRKAANQKQPAAQYRLAKLYEQGIGVAADPAMARQLTEMAARSGNRIAMHDLGLYYADGRGDVAKNFTIALSWFEKAAERGVVDSQFNLGLLYGSTPEIPQDLVTAYVWFSIAVAQGDQVANGELAKLKEKMSPAEVKQAKARAAGFKPVAINEAANGIFREVPWAMPSANNFKPTSDLVRDAQSLLGQLGYDVGVPDGDMGPKTRAAVQAFERANGLPESGSVTGSLIDRLEAAAGV